MNYTLTRDGVKVFTGTEEEIMAYVHKTHPYSVYHALKYEGYQVEVSA